MESKDCVIWTNDQRRQVRVTGRNSQPVSGTGMPDRWCDPIGANYRQWQKMTEGERAQLMTEVALDLAMKGYRLPDVIREFAKVDCFLNLGRESIPMCVVLTQVLCGKRLEPNTMDFDDLLRVYKPDPKREAEEADRLEKEWLTKGHDDRWDLS